MEVGDSAYPTPWPIRWAAMTALARGMTHYTASSGLPVLKYAIMRDQKRHGAFVPEPDQIVVAPANGLIELIIRAVCNPGDDAVVADPCFPTYLTALRQCGVGIRRVPLRLEFGSGFDATTVAAAMTDRTRLVIVNAPHNPTGGVFLPGDGGPLIELCRSRGITLLSDEVYDRLLFDGRTHVSFASPRSCSDTVVLLKSFSKVFSMSGFRLGFAAGPLDIMRKVDLLFQGTYSCVPPFVQAAGIRALGSDTDRMVTRHVRWLERNRDLMLAGIRATPRLVSTYPYGGLYGFVSVAGLGMTGEEFAFGLLERQGVVVLPGTAFGTACPDHVRLCFAGRRSSLHEGMRRIKEFVCTR